MGLEGSCGSWMEHNIVLSSSFHGTLSYRNWLQIWAKPPDFLHPPGSKAYAAMPSLRVAFKTPIFAPPAIVSELTLRQARLLSFKFSKFESSPTRASSISSRQLASSALIRFKVDANSPRQVRFYREIRDSRVS
jgi:hypothetical protein